MASNPSTPSRHPHPIKTNAWTDGDKLALVVAQLKMVALNPKWSKDTSVPAGRTLQGAQKMWAEIMKQAGNVEMNSGDSVTPSRARASYNRTAPGSGSGTKRGKRRGAAAGTKKGKAVDGFDAEDDDEGFDGGASPLKKMTKVKHEVKADTAAGDDNDDDATVKAETETFENDAGNRSIFGGGDSFLNGF